MRNDRKAPPGFDVDGMLGGLAKWLRTLGFDAAFPCKAPGPGRIFVTGARDKRSPATVLVTTDSPMEQLREVIQASGTAFDPESLFTRCLVCNEPVSRVSEDVAIGRVPEGIARNFTKFNQCPLCGRVYWEGSHRARIKRRLAEAGLM